MSGEETGLLAILASLVANEVEFVLVGGLAVGHHGYPRATKDVDIVVTTALIPGKPVRQGADQITVTALDAQVLALGDFRRDELPVALSLEALQQGADWDLSTIHGRLDIIQYREGALETAEDYERLRAGAVPDRYHFGTVWVAGYDDLIDLKTLAGRDQDLADIRAMREANEDTAP